MKRRTRVLREDNYRAESNVLFPSPRGSGSQGLKALLVVLGVCLAGGAWGQDLQIVGKIAFVSLLSGNYEVYTINADGTNQTNLTNNSGVDANATWSPDGTKVAFYTSRDGNPEVYVMNADGANQTRLTNNTTTDSPSSWSPDGTKITFISERDGNREIYVMNADGTNPVRLTNNSAEDSSPSWSPDGAKIAFHSNRDGNWEIYAMNADGTGQTRLTNNSADDAAPTWSPDGTKIAFNSERDGNREIYVMNADGTNQTRLTNNSAVDWSASWSPDGTKIAFHSNRDGNGDIYVVNADGSNLVRATNLSAVYVDFSWGDAFRRIGAAAVGSPVSRTMTIQNSGSATLTVSNITSSDGQFTINPTNFSVAAGGSQNVAVTFTPTSTGTKYSTLTITSNDLDAPTAKLIVNGTATAAPVPVFSFSTGSLTNSKIAFQSTRDGNNEIYAMDADGANQTRLTNNSVVDGIPYWSPDGTKIAFLRDVSGNYQIFTMNADGSNVTQLTSTGNNLSHLRWSPDGTKIAFASTRDGNYEIYAMNADGSNVARLTNNSAEDAQPCWSPDGSKIVFYSTRDGNQEIYTMDADGSNQTRLMSHSAEDTEPSWSPDGSKISFTTNRDGNIEVYVVNADGSNVGRLTSNGATDRHARWSPDGSKLVFDSDRDGNVEIYTMNADGTSQTRLTNNGANDSEPHWSPFLRTLNLGTVTQNSSGTATFTVTNRGNGTLTISGISVSGTDAAQFSASPTSFSLAAGGIQTVAVTFSPTSSGAKSGSLSIAHNAGGSPATVSLSGTGTAPDLQIAGKIAFESNRDGNYEIYTMNSDGTSQTRLTNNATHDYTSVWSPDGTKMAFVTYSDGPGDIYVMSTDGTGKMRLTTAQGSSPSWSSDGTKIAFASTRDGNYEIYVMNADGTGQTRLTNNSGVDSRPSWSPDGTKIAFSSTRDGNFEIYVMNADGTSQTRLTNNSALDDAPSWSPDGTKIAFNTDRDGNYEVYVMNVDGSGQTNLSNNSAYEDSPTWSPDGTKIAFRSGRGGNYDIYAMNADGTNQTRLTSHSEADDHPYWGEAFRRVGSSAVGSPVSRTMIIENKGNGTLNVSNITSSDGQFTISPTNFSVNAGGSQNVTVTFTPTSAGTKYSTLTISSNDLDAPVAKLVVNGTATTAPVPAFSFSTGSLAGNTKITFQSWRDGNTEIYAMNADGSGQVNLTNHSARDENPVWSPDGTKIAFWSMRDIDFGVQSNGGEIYVMNADGTSQTRLTNNSTEDGYDLAWSPDGTKIGFGSKRDGHWEIYAMNTDGTNQTRLTTSTESAVEPAWSPDGTRIAFWSGGLYVMNADGTGKTSLYVSGRNPSWSPDGTKIIFHDGPYEIYAINPDGTGLTQLTNTPSGSALGPSWSPDGVKIAYVKGNGGDHIYTMNADGTGQTQLTTASDGWPAWSPFLRTLNLGTVTKNSSGTTTFTVTNRGNGTLSVSGISVSGTDAAQFTASPTNFSLVAGASQTVTVTFSPSSTGAKSASLSITHNAGGSPATVALSGTGAAPDLQIAGKIAFVSLVGAEYVVNTMNADGTSQTTLTNNSATAANPSLSPDGTKIAFNSSRDGNYEIYVMNADGTNQTRLTNNPAPDYISSWSPDGTKIVFTSNRDGNPEIYTMAADGTNQARLTNSSGEDSNPSWAPDGTKIAFRSDRSGNAEVYVMNADGTNPINLTNNSAADDSPFWSSDGTKIAFYSNREGSENWEVYVMNADGANQTRLTSNAAADQDPSWSPDGTKIAFQSKRDGNGDIYLMNADGSNPARVTNLSTVYVGISWGEAFRRIGSVAVGSPVSRTMIIENKGNGTLNVSNITSSDGQFAISPTNFNVAPGSSQNVTVTFTPTSAGVKYSTLTISSNDGDAPTARLTVNGTGQETTPIYSPSATSVSVSSAVTKSSSGTATFTVTNSGGGTLSVSSITSSNAQFTASPTSFNLTAGVSQTVTVTFAPAKVGWEQGALSIVHNAAGSPSVVAASGIGRVNPPSGVLSTTKIAFSSVRDGNDEVYTMNTDGANQTRLTNNSAMDGSPSWSPDGTKMVFFSDRDGNREVYTMNADGSGQARLSNASGEDSSPSWSPDGTKIVFRSERDGSPEVYVMNTDGTNQTRLTNNSAYDGQTSWSPDGTKIAFTSDRDGNTEMYAMNADGTNQIRLTSNVIVDQVPFWSPDGTKIAFVSERDGNAEIYVMNADGSNQIRLTNNTAIDHQASWSPDGAKIVFFSNRDGNNEIYTMNTDGTNQTRVTNNSSNDDGASWSSFIATPNPAFPTTPVVFSSPVTKTASGTATFTITNSGGGTLSVSNITSSNSQFTATPASFNLTAGASQTVTVTFTPTKVGWEQGTLSIAHNAVGNPSAVTASGIGRVNPPSGSLSNTRIAFSSERDGSSGIYTMNIEGTNQTRLTSGGGGPWSPDGTKIALGTGGEIYVINTDGTNQIRLTNNSATDGSPSWSPDGTKIAFHSDRDGNSEIYVMSTDGTSQTRLTNNSALDYWPSWSPDGTKVAFQSDRDGNWEIYVMSADGSNQTKLTNNSAPDGKPVWSPDGAKITFISDRDGTREIYVMNTDGTNQTRLTNNSTFDDRPFYSPDGTKVVFFSDRDGNNEIYTMNADGSSPTRLTNNTVSDDGPYWSPFITTPTITLSTTSVNAGSINKGASGTATFTVSNSGGGTLSVSNITSSNGQFSALPTSFNLTAGVSQTVTVTFSPTSGTPQGTVQSGTLTLTHNAAPTATSSTVSVSGTGVDPAPATPAGLAATAGNGQVALSWTANSEADLSHYLIYRSTTDNFTPAGTDSIARVSKPTAAYTNTGLGVGTYYFKIAAMDSAGNKSGFSAQTTVALAPIVSLSSTLVSAGSVNAGSSGQATFTVGNTGNAALSVTGITVGGTDAAQFAVSPTSFTINAGAAAQTVTVTFTPSSAGAKSASLSIAHNASGSPSAVALSGTGVDPAPASPTSLAATAGNAQVSLSWTANPESDLSHYVIYRSTTNNFTPAPADSIARVNKPALTYTNTGLAAGTYYFKLAAVDSAGNKSAFSTQASAALTVLVKASDPNPASLRFAGSSSLSVSVSDSGNTSLSVTPTITGGDAAQFSVSPNAVTAVSPGAAQSFTVTFAPSPATGSNRSATLNLAHTATNKGTPLTVSLVGDVSPTAPANLSADGGINRAVLNWSANSEGDLSHYVVYRSVANNFTPTAADSVGRVSKPTATFTNTGLRGGTYYFRLAAVDSAGNKSAFSTQDSAIIEPHIVVSPTALSFGNVRTGATRTQAFTVSNTGTDTLNVSALSLSGTDAGRFVFSPAALVVAPGAAAQVVSVSFSPTVGSQSATPKSAVLSFTDNAPESPQLSLSGIATAPAIALSPSPLDFGSVTIGQSATSLLTVANTGTDTLLVSSLALSGTNANQFPLAAGQGNPLYTIAPNASQAISVPFTPTTAGSKSAILTLTHNAAPTATSTTVNFSGTGSSIPVPTLAPNPLAFGNVRVGQSRTLNLTVTNNSAVALTVSSIAASGAAFTVSPASLSLTANGTGTIAVTFTPTNREAQTATLTLGYSTSSGSAQVTGNLTGQGIQPAIAAAPSDTLRFGDVNIETEQRRVLPLTLYNTGNDTLTISEIVRPAGVFSVAPGVPPALSLKGGDSTRVNVTYTPSAIRIDTAGVVIRSNAANNQTLRVGLAGRGVLVGFVVRPDTLDFGRVRLDSVRTRTYTVANPGNLRLEVTATSISNPRFSVSPRVFNVNGGDSTRVTVTFSPGQKGIEQGILSLGGNVAAEKTVVVRGEGAQPEMAFSPADSMDFGGVRLAETTTQSLVISNTGNDTLKVTNISRDNQRFSVSDSSFNVLPTNTKTIEVRFTPTQVDRDERGQLIFATNVGIRNYRVRGRGIESAWRVSPNPLTFGRVRVDSSRSFSVSIVNSGQARVVIDSLAVVNGAGTVELTRLELPPSIPAGATADVATVRFVPRVLGDLSGVTLRVKEGGTIQLVQVQGSGFSPPDMVVTPDSLTLGPVALGAVKTGTLEIRNTGGDTLHLSQLRSDQEGFSVAPATLTLAPGASGTVSVSFRPVAEGAVRTRLLFAGDDPSPPQVGLLGTTIVSPPILSFSPADTLIFGIVAPGGSERQLLRLRNRGRSPLQVVLSSESEEFVPARLDTISVAAQDSTRTLIRFTPSRAGTRLGTLVLSSNDPEVPLATLALKGTGGGLRFEPPSVEFGEVALGAQVDTTVTLINQTANRVQLTLDLTGLGFSIDPKSLNLEPNTSGRVRVRFQPPVESDDYSGEVKVRGRGLSVTLAGTGMEGPDIDVLPSRDFGEVEVGQVGVGTITVRNVGRGPLKLFDLIPSRLEYRVAQADSLPLVIPAGGDHALQLFFTPDTSGEFRGSLSIISNDPDADEREVIRNLNGRGRIVRQPQPRIEVVIGEREDEFSFGLLDEGEERELSLVVRNRGDGVLRVERIEADNSQVSALPESLVVAAGESRRVGVRIQAQQGQPQEGVLRLASNDVARPVIRKRWHYDRPVPGVVLLTERLVFGPVEEGQRSALLALHNRGNARLIVDLVDDSRQLSFAEDRLLIEAGQVERVRVGYSGSGGSGQVVLATNDPGRRQLTVPWNAEQVLELEESVPGNGDASVPLKGTLLSLFFNQPLRQVGSLAGAAGQGGGLIALQGRMVPEPLNPWRRQMRLQGSEVQIPLELEANTNYRLIVVDAESQSGAKLGSPFEVTFSTGRSAPALGSIAGSVRWSDGSSLAGTVFVANEQRELVGSARIGTDGSFTVGSVPAGGYSLFAQEEGTGLSAAYDQTVRVAAGSAVVGVAIRVPVQAPVVVAVAPLDEAVALPEELPALNADSTFVLAFRTDPVEDLTGFAIQVSFDPSKVYLVEASGDSAAVKNALYGSGGFPLFLNRVVDEGTVEFGGALLGAKETTAPDGGGLLAVFTFKALDTEGYGVNVDHIIRRTLRGEDRVAGRSIGGHRGSGADFDGSGVVDFGDFFLFADAFGQSGTGANARYDLDKSGTVDFGDFFIFADAFGKAGGATAKLIALAQERLGLPATPRLEPAYPNPFNPETTIRYQLAAAGLVKLAVYNVLGQQVRVLVEGVQEPGAYQLVWDGRDQAGMAVASGVYFLRLEAGSFAQVQKTVLVR